MPSNDKFSDFFGTNFPTKYFTLFYIFYQAFYFRHFNLNFWQFLVTNEALKPHKLRKKHLRMLLQATKAQTQRQKHKTSENFCKSDRQKLFLISKHLSEQKKVKRKLLMSFLLMNSIFSLPSVYGRMFG